MSHTCGTEDKVDSRRESLRIPLYLFFFKFKQSNAETLFNGKADETSYCDWIVS